MYMDFNLLDGAQIKVLLCMDFILLDGADIKVFDVFGFHYFRWGGYKSFQCIWILLF